jgi:DNA repair photolyase
MSKTLKILSRPQGNAEEYGRWAVNAYLGCSNSCEYCYLKNGPGAKTLGSDVAALKKGVVSAEHAYHLAMAEIIEHREEIIRDGGLFMTFTSDPYLPETRGLMSRIVKSCIKQHEVPVTILTKRADF